MSRQVHMKGTQRYINAESGESVEMNVVEVRDGDNNFQKFWVANILAAVEALSSKKLKLVLYLIEKSAKNQNTIIATVAQIAQESNMSVPTVTRTLKVLEECDVIKRKPGVIWMNPDVVYKGSASGRVDVLMRYHSVPKKLTHEEKRQQIDQELELVRRRHEALELERLALHRHEQTEFDPMDPTTHPPAPF